MKFQLAKRRILKYINLFSTWSDVIILIIQTTITGRPAQNLIVGDSHSAFLAGSRLKKFCSGEDNFFCFWVGPRLLYSVATKGLESFPFFLMKRIAWNSVIFIFGEIDVRVFLAKKNDFQISEAIADSYVSECIRISRLMKANSLLVLAPVPPSDLGAENPKFPRRGSLNDRVRAHRELIDVLQKACKKNSVSFLDTTEILINENGSINAHLTDDGCHLNSIGSRLVRTQISLLVMNRRTQRLC